jgi:hypothetical protein
MKPWSGNGPLMRSYRILVVFNGLSVGRLIRAAPGLLLLRRQIGIFRPPRVVKDVVIGVVDESWGVLMTAGDAPLLPPRLSPAARGVAGIPQAPGRFGINVAVSGCG